MKRCFHEGESGNQQLADFFESLHVTLLIHFFFFFGFLHPDLEGKESYPIYCQKITLPKAMSSLPIL